MYSRWGWNYWLNDENVIKLLKIFFYIGYLYVVDK